MPAWVQRDYALGTGDMVNDMLGVSTSLTCISEVYVLSPLKEALKRVWKDLYSVQYEPIFSETYRMGSRFRDIPAQTRNVLPCLGDTNLKKADRK